MSKIMPQELEVWYLLPALRREFVTYFVENKKLSQKDAAGLLGITESAASQYLKGKRGNDLQFKKKDLVKIHTTADAILADPEHMVQIVYELCKEFRGSDIMCDLHHLMDSDIEKSCDVCLECAK